MTLSKKFNILVHKWERYVQRGRGPSGIQVMLSSYSWDVYECKPRYKLKELGESILPLIRKLYDKDHEGNYPLEIIKGHGLPALVSSIAGEDKFNPLEVVGRPIGKCGDFIAIDVRKLEEFTKNWLDTYLSTTSKD